MKPSRLVTSAERGQRPADQSDPDSDGRPVMFASRGGCP